MEEYEIVPPHYVVSSKMIIDLWEKLGKPQNPFSNSGRKVLDFIIEVWKELYPSDYENWLAIRSDYKKSELSIEEQVRKETGRSLASYPMFVYKVMKVVFPNFDPAERKNCMRMAKLYPIFRFANKL